MIHTGNGRGWLVLGHMATILRHLPTMSESGIAGTHSRPPLSHAVYIPEPPAGMCQRPVLHSSSSGRCQSDSGCCGTPEHTGWTRRAAAVAAQPTGAGSAAHRSKTFSASVFTRRNHPPNPPSFKKSISNKAWPLTSAIFSQTLCYPPIPFRLVEPRIINLFLEFSRSGLHLMSGP